MVVQLFLPLTQLLHSLIGLLYLVLLSTPYLALKECLTLLGQIGQLEQLIDQPKLKHND
jgi:hypothetical protein